MPRTLVDSIGWQRVGELALAGGRWQVAGAARAGGGAAAAQTRFS
jgi:hypothetical protein